MTTYNFYTRKYFGDIVPEDSFEKWESRAVDELNYITGNKIETVEEYPENIQKAVCALVDVMYQIDMEMKHSGTNEDGTGKVVKSKSSGNESISYEVQNSLFTTVLTNTKAQGKLKYEAVRPYLSGTGLLYMGC